MSHPKPTVSGTDYPTRVNAAIDALDRRLKGNLLINGDFRVWQRGTSFASGAVGYTADRWQCYRSGAVAGATFSRQTGQTAQYAFRMQRDSGNASTADLIAAQTLETADVFQAAGQNIIFKLRVRCGANYSASGSVFGVQVYYGTGTDQSYGGGLTGQVQALSVAPAVTTTQAIYETTAISIPSSAREIAVVVTYVPTGTASTNDWLEVEECQLVIGDYAGNFPYRPFAEELALCQRYYEKSYDMAVAPGTNSQPGAHLFAARAADQIDERTVYFKVRKRTTPTIVLYSTTGASGNFRNISGAANITAAIESGYQGDQGFSAHTTANTTSANIYGFQWTAEAEL